MRQQIDARIPRTKELIEPTFNALKKLGGSGKNEEILNQIIIDLNIPDEVVDILHKDNPNKTELSYQADWARTYLSKYGIIENSARSVWSIKSDYFTTDSLDVDKIYKAVRSSRRLTDDNNHDEYPSDDDPSNDYEEFPDELKPWREKLSNVLQNMDPYGFERLAQRVLRECGFTQVIVTPGSGDNGIDGTGKLRVNGVFSFNVAFQCKRYTGAVGPSEIRDFRGSLTKGVEKGVFITTGTFSKAAVKEAEDPGKLQIDLINGEDLITMIAEYGIGVKPVTTYEIDEEFFKNI